MSSETRPISRRSKYALDALNFFLSDVRDGIGPFLAVYLLADRHWTQDRIGLAMAAMTLATVVAQTPAGGLVDRSRRKRLLTAGSAALVAVACVAMTLSDAFAVIVAAQVVCGVAAAVLLPAVAAISLGLVGHKALDRRIGRNEAFNHAGNVAAAAAAGLIGRYVADAGIFWLVAGMAALSVVAALAIPPGEIDHDVARGSADEKPEPGEADAAEAPSGLRLVFADRKLLAFAASVVLFHFANAAMLPLVGMLLASTRGQDTASFWMAACVIVAQLVMVPVAAASGRLADGWGRRPVFLIGFAVLPVRGVLYVLGDSPGYLLAVQALDGIGAGVFGVVSVLMIADLTRGTGRFNLVQGVIATALGIGASLSVVLAGYVVEYAGYDAAFLSLAALAAVALAAFWVTVPETAAERRSDPARPSDRREAAARKSSGEPAADAV